jgi:hypothetical protein
MGTILLTMGFGEGRSSSPWRVWLSLIGWLTGVLLGQPKPVPASLLVNTYCGAASGPQFRPTAT